MASLNAVEAPAFAPAQLAEALPKPEVFSAPPAEILGPVALFYTRFGEYTGVESTSAVMADVIGEIRRRDEAAITVKAMCVVCTSHKAARGGMAYSPAPGTNEAFEGEQ
jgi:hypothetical protein